MQQRTWLQKKFYGYALRRLKRKATVEERQLIELALLDSAIFQMAYEETMEEIIDSADHNLGFSIARAADGAPIVDNLLKLLDWFVKNGPALIEVIKVIAELFGGIAQASAILREEMESGEIGQ